MQSTKSTRVFIKTSLLVSLCASASTSCLAQASSGNSTAAKKKVALALPLAVNTQTRPQVQAPQNMSQATKRAARASYPANAYQRGLYLKQQGRLKEALIEFIRSAHEDPRQVKAFYEQALIFKQLGNKKLAKSALEQALAISPQYTDARTMLVQTHFESGNLIGAASEVGKLFNLNAPKKTEGADFLAYQGAPSAAIQIAKGNLPKTSLAPAPEQAPGTIIEQTNKIDKGNEDVSAWLNSASESTTTPQPHTTSDTTSEAAPKQEGQKSAADVLASLGLSPASTAGESKPPASSPMTSAKAVGENAQSNANGSSLVGRMRARTGQAFSSVSKISKVNIAAIHKIPVPHVPVPKAAVPHVAVPHMNVPQWMKDHIPFMPQDDQKDSNIAQNDAAGIREQAASAMNWMRDKLPFPSKEKQNRQLAEKMKMAMDAASKGPALSPEVAKAIEAKLAQNKSAENAANAGEKNPLEQQLANLKLDGASKDVKISLNQIDPKSAAKDLASAQEYDPRMEAMSKLSPNLKDKKVKSMLNLASQNVDENTRAILNNLLQDQNQAPIAQKKDPAPISPISAQTKPGEVDKTDKAGSPEKPQAIEAADDVKKILNTLGSNLGQGEAETNKAPEPMSPLDKSLTEKNPSYGLVGNNALKHISTLPVQKGEDKPSFLDSIWQQAGNTFSKLMPKIDWKLPTVDPASLFTKKEPSPELIAATTDPASMMAQQGASTTAATANSSGTANVPLPLDVSRILNKIGPGSSEAKQTVVAPPLSAVIPIAAPNAIDSYIPKPQEAPTQKLASLPQIMPQGLRPSNNKVVGPLTSPQQSTAQQLPVLPPVVQKILDQTAPIFKPALDAANSIAQSMAPAPVAIPKGEGSNPTPVDMTSVNDGNGAPAPLSANMSGMVNDSLRPTVPSAQENSGLTKSGGRKLVDIAQEKNGAFTYSKAVMDSDSSFLLGAKQIRTIKTPSMPAPKPPPPPPEDAITKRMRYLMENGTSNLRPGEAFMFSEETGEGILFLPGGRTERRKLTDGRDSETVRRERRPELMQSKDLQYSLQLLGKLMKNQNVQEQQQQQGQALNGPSLDQLMNQVNQGSRSVWDWMRSTFNGQK